MTKKERNENFSSISRSRTSSHWKNIKLKHLSLSVPILIVLSEAKHFCENRCFFLDCSSFNCNWEISVKDALLLTHAVFNHIRKHTWKDWLHRKNCGHVLLVHYIKLLSSESTSANSLQVKDPSWVIVLSAMNFFSKVGVGQYLTLLVPQTTNKLPI